MAGAGPTGSPGEQALDSPTFHETAFFRFLMLAASAITEKYRCPGEAYSITESVHLARLAAFYSKCRHCPHAPGAEMQLPAADGGAAAAGTASQFPLFTTEGVRGRHLNDLTRPLAAELTGAMASCLWEASFAVPPAGGPPVETQAKPPEGGTTSGGITSESIRLLKPERPGPLIVLAHDERPSSPDIVTGAGQALRRMGCQVVDLGVVTRPALMFALDHLHAAGAVYVTGAGCDPGWTGLDFVGGDGIPSSAPGQLDAISARYHSGYSRPSRRPGSQRTFDASVPYQASLWKHFHALRPLKIALACPSPGVRDVFQQAFRKVGCRLLSVETPTRSRQTGDSADPDSARTSQAVRDSGAHLGLLIEDDGEQCTIFDDRGMIVPPEKMATLFANLSAVDHQGSARIVLPAAWSGTPSQLHANFVNHPNREHITRAMKYDHAAFGADGHGRYWFAETYPTCDALLTLVHLLHALSRSDTPFSEIAGGNLPD